MAASLAAAGGFAQNLAWPLCGVAIVLAVASGDCLHRRVPNLLVLAALAWSIALRSQLHGRALGGSAEALIIFVVLTVGYVNGWLGAADAKVGAAFAWMVGADAMTAFVVASVVSCLLLSCAWLIVVEGLSVSQAVQRVQQPHQSLQRARRERTTMPLTVCFAVGALWASRGGQLWRV